MKNQHLFLPVTLAATAVVLFTTSPVAAQILGTAGSYGALGGSAVTNSGNTLILGDLGTSPGAQVTGFAAVDAGPGIFTGTLNRANGASAQAQADLTTAYSTLAALSFTSDLSGMDLGGLTLTPGVYHFNSTAQLTGALTLDAQGDNNARFVFQIGSSLITASNARVNIINISSDNNCGPDNGLFWQVGSSATIGTGTEFAGNILALTSITLNEGVSIQAGRALARNGLVALTNNLIDARDADGGFCTTPGVIVPVPEASTYGLVGSCLLLFVVGRRQIAGRRRY